MYHWNDDCGYIPRGTNMASVTRPPGARSMASCPHAPEMQLFVARVFLGVTLSLQIKQPRLEDHYLYQTATRRAATSSMSRMPFTLGLAWSMASCPHAPAMSLPFSCRMVHGVAYSSLRIARKASHCTQNNTFTRTQASGLLCRCAFVGCWRCICWASRRRTAQTEHCIATTKHH